MITLRTLREASLQEIFDQSARHLLAQNAKSLVMRDGVSSCLYRSPNGLKCAVGIFIADDEYALVEEGLTAGGLCPQHGATAEQTSLLSRLQTIHDSWDVEVWRDRLADLATCAGLSSAVLDAQP